LALTEAALRSALERIGSDAPVRFDEVTGSTQVTALRFAEAGAPEWTLVAAGHQTHGRGRLGRTWLDVPGALLCSVVLRPPLHPELGGLLTLLAGSAMTEALRDVIGAEIRCKWPNDLTLADAKVGGILAESVVREGRLAYVCLGVGVNLGHAPDVDGAAVLAGADAGEVLGAFLEAFARDYRPAERGFAAAVVERAKAVSATLGRRVRATTIDGGMLAEGEAVDLGPDGSLVVETAPGTATFVRSGEVEHLRALPG
jgi:BirA family biotin operon repressor/biotin-[acetyl-CoA-carboxylase] ligase